MADQIPKKPSIPKPSTPTSSPNSRPQPGASPGRNDQQKGIARPPSVRPPKR